MDGHRARPVPAHVPPESRRLTRVRRISVSSSCTKAMPGALASQLHCEKVLAMPMVKFSDGERFSRLQQLDDKLRRELELVRRSRAARASSAAAKTRAAARATSTRRRTRNTR